MNYSEIRPVLTPNEMPWSWPAVTSYYLQRTPILNSSQREVGWNEESLCPSEY